MQVYEWIALEPPPEAWNLPFKPSLMGTQLEFEMDEVEIMYTRSRLRFKHERGQTGTLLCLLPPEAAAYFLQEVDTSLTNEHNTAFLFKVEPRDMDGEKVSAEQSEARHE